MLTGAAGTILVATAALHASAYLSVRSAVVGSSLPDFFRGSLPGIWLFFSWHVFAVALATLWISLKASPNARPLLVFCAFVVCVDTIFVFSLAGIFLGTILLAIAAVLLALTAIRWKTI